MAKTASGRRPKRVKKYDYYYTIWDTPLRTIQKVRETHSEFDNRRYESGNYYPDRESAAKVLRQEALLAAKIREALQESEKKNSGRL